MVARWAYWLKDVSLLHVADSPKSARLRRAWPNLPDDPDQQWMAQPHPNGGTLVAWPRTRDSAGVTLDSFGEPRDTHDGMVYYPSRDRATLTDLIRPERHRIGGTWVTLASGETLFVALATATPRELILRASGRVELGKHASEYGLLGHDLFEPFISADGISYTDTRLGRLLFLALQQSYWVTEEMAEDDPWLTTADINAVAHAIMGIDPKASAAVPDGSASVDQATAKSP